MPPQVLTLLHYGDFVTTPIYRTVRRTWRERLFTLPWTPHRAWRKERDHVAESEAHFERLRAALKAHREARLTPGVASSGRVSAAYVGKTDTTGTATYVPSPSYSAPVWFTSEAAQPAQPAEVFQSLGGGDFGGAGATASWEAPAPAPSTDSYASSSCSASDYSSSSSSDYSSSDSSSSSCDSSSSSSSD